MPRCCSPADQPTSRAIRLTAAAATLAILLVYLATTSGQDKPAPPDEKQALTAFNPLIGHWRGVGMPKRNSRADAWIETAEWVWEFKDGTPGIRYEVDDGQLLDTALLTYDAESETFRLKATLPDESTRSYTGARDGKKLVLESEPDADGNVHRLTVNPLNEKRTLVLHERRKADQRLTHRVAEVGYTREGTSLAVEGAGQPECVVTGGTGTIRVSYKGETYWVCCTGCKQAFEDDPEGVVAEYRQRLAERRTARGTK